MAVELKIVYPTVTLTLSINSWKETTPSRIDEIVMPRRHGAKFEYDAKLATRTFSLEGILRDTTAANLRTKLDDLVQKLNYYGKGKLYLHSDRYWEVAKDNLDYNYRPGLVSLAYVLSLKADPLAFDNAASQATETCTGNKTFSKTIGGTAKNWPTITIAITAAGCTGVKLTNSTESKYWKYDAAIANGQSLVIDGEQKTCNNGGVADLAHFKGEFWELVVGNNSFNYEGVACVITFDYRGRFF